MSFSGIDVYELIMELKMGIRLPTPEYCPLAIGNLIQTCFIEQPNERPSFFEIKESVLVAYSGIKRAGRTMITNTSNNLQNIEYTDVQMVSKYWKMHKMNRDYQKEGNVVLKNEDHQLQLDEVSIKSFPTKDTGTYLSLGCLISLDGGKLPSADNEFLTTFRKHNIRSMDINKFSDMSTRRYSEDPIGAILPSQMCSAKTRSKSYEVVSLSFSNPSYMMHNEKRILTQPETSE